MKTVRALLGLLLVVVVCYVLWNMIPPYFHNYKLEGIVSDEARMNTYTNKTEDQMKDTIFEKAQEMDMPITRDQIEVQRGGNSVAISINYTVHLDFPVHPVDLQFHTSSSNTGIN